MSIWCRDLGDFQEYANRYLQIVMRFEHFSEKDKTKLDLLIAQYFGEGAFNGMISGDLVSFALHKGNIANADFLSRMFPDALVSATEEWDNFKCEFFRNGEEYKRYSVSWLDPDSHEELRVIVALPWGGFSDYTIPVINHDWDKQYEDFSYSGSKFCYQRDPSIKEWSRIDQHNNKKAADWLEEKLFAGGDYNAIYEQKNMAEVEKFTIPASLDKPESIVTVSKVQLVYTSNRDENGNKVTKGKAAPNTIHYAVDADLDYITDDAAAFPTLKDAVHAAKLYVDKETQERAYLDYKNSHSPNFGGLL